MALLNWNQWEDFGVGEEKNQPEILKILLINNILISKIVVLLTHSRCLFQLILVIFGNLHEKHVVS
jgi:hypothetical protein